MYNIETAPSGGVTLLGGGTGYVLRPALDRYRVTWRFVAAGWVPDSSLDTYRVAVAVRDALPALGMIPVSPVSAVGGDPFVQFTVQVAHSSKLTTIADMIDAANRLPVISTAAGGVSLRLALDVSEIEIRSAGLSTTIVAAQDWASRQRAFDEAKRRDVFVQAQQAASAAAQAVGAGVSNVAGAVTGAATSTSKGFFGGLSDLAKLTIITIGVVGVAIAFGLSRVGSGVRTVRVG